MNKKDRNQLILSNLLHFYLSKKEATHVTHYHDAYIHAVVSSKIWPRMIFLKDPNNTDLSQMLDAANKATSESVSWVLNEHFVQHNKHLLLGAGLLPYRSWTGMYLHPEEPIKTQHTKDNPALPRIHVETIVKADDISAFVELVNHHIYGKTLLYTNDYISKLNDDRYQFFRGRLKGETIATGLSFDDGDTVGLYFISVNPKYRGKGYGQDFVSQMINTLIIEGHKDFVLHATRAGNRLYENIGFEAYEKLNIFVKMKTTE